MTVAAINHIHLDERGVAWIHGTNTKVIEVVLDKLAYGWSAEEIHFQHPHLSMGQIHAALSYYHDHAGEIDTEIARQRAEVEAMRTQAQEQPRRSELESRLKAKTPEVPA